MPMACSSCANNTWASSISPAHARLSDVAKMWDLLRLLMRAAVENRSHVKPFSETHAEMTSVMSV